LAAALVMAFGSAARADWGTWTPDRVYAGYDYLPEAGLAHPQTGTFEDQVRWQESTFSAGLSLPTLTAGDGWSFGQGFSYRYFSFDFDQWDPSVLATPPDALHAIRYQFTARKKLENRQSIDLFLSPGLDSDLHNVQWDHANVLGGLKGNIPLGHSLFGIGLAYTMTFGRPRLLPVLTWQWSDQRHWRANVLLPALAEIWYRFSPAVESGLCVGFSGGDFRIGEAGPYQDENVRWSTGKLGPEVRVTLAKDWSLKVLGGWAFHRQYGVYDGTNEIQDLGSNDSGFIQTSVAYRFGPGKNEPLTGWGMFQ